jgi:hypothetical protein
MRSLRRFSEDHQMKDEALKLALEALETCDGGTSWADPYQIFDPKLVEKAITAIKQALAAQQEHEPENEPFVSLASVQEPVAWRSQLASGNYTYCNTPQFFDNAEPLYTTPPAAQPAQAQGPYSAPVKELWSVAPKAAAQPAPVQPVQEPLSKKWKWDLHESFADVAGFDEEGIPSFYWKESVNKYKSGELSVPCKGKNCGSLNGWLHSSECRAEHEAQYTPPAQPAVPDALTSADIQEHIEYVSGWNDCRQAMMEMMK